MTRMTPGCWWRRTTRSTATRTWRRANITTVTTGCQRAQAGAKGDEFSILAGLKPGLRAVWGVDAKGGWIRTLIASMEFGGAMRIAVMAALVVFAAACNEESVLQSPTSPTSLTAPTAGGGMSAPLTTQQSAGGLPNRLTNPAAAAMDVEGIVCRNGRCWREEGYFHPECPDRELCVVAFEPLIAGRRRPGLIEVQVGKWAPPFDRTVELLMSVIRARSDLYLETEMMVGKRPCANGECAIRILPGQVSSAHDRRGVTRVKRALKVHVTDYWQPGYEGNTGCPGTARLAIEARGMYGVEPLPVDVCR